MLNKIKSYFTLRAESTTKLDEMVNAEIAKGLQPYGCPYVFRQTRSVDGVNMGDTLVCQVVVRQNAFSVRNLGSGHETFEGRS